MVDLSELTPAFCLQVVVNSTPKPSRWKSPPDTPSTKTLFDLGVIDAATAAVFVQKVKDHIDPLHIHNNDIASSPDTTLQKAANSVQTNAY